MSAELEDAIKIQNTCHKNISLNVPKFIKANEGLQKITPRQIEELQTVKEPSQTLLTLAKAICIIMKVKPSILKLKDEKFVSRECFWNAFLGV